MTGSPSALVVGSAGTVLRRRLGPTAWVVLEAAVALANNADGDLVVEASVRSLALEVGLAKNTVARALSLLRACGLLAFTQTRAGDGVFGAGRYVIPARSALRELRAALSVGGIIFVLSSGLVYADNFRAVSEGKHPSVGIKSYLLLGFALVLGVATVFLAHRVDEEKSP